MKNILGGCSAMQHTVGFLDDMHTTSEWVTFCNQLLLLYQVLLADSYTELNFVKFTFYESCFVTRLFYCIMFCIACFVTKEYTEDEWCSLTPTSSGNTMSDRLPLKWLYHCQRIERSTVLLRNFSPERYPPCPAPA